MNRTTCTVREAAEILGVGLSTLYDHMSADGIVINDGADTIAILRIGQRVVISIAELERVTGGPVEAAS